MVDRDCSNRPLRDRPIERSAGHRKLQQRRRRFELKSGKGSRFEFRSAARFLDVDRQRRNAVKAVSIGKLQIRPKVFRRRDHRRESTRLRPKAPAAIDILKVTSVSISPTSAQFDHVLVLRLARKIAYLQSNNMFNTLNEWFIFSFSSDRQVSVAQALGQVLRDLPRPAVSLKNTILPSKLLSKFRQQNAGECLLAWLLQRR